MTSAALRYAGMPSFIFLSQKWTASRLHLCKASEFIKYWRSLSFPKTQNVHKLLVFSPFFKIKIFKHRSRRFHRLIALLVPDFHFKWSLCCSVTQGTSWFLSLLKLSLTSFPLLSPFFFFSWKCSWQPKGCSWTQTTWRNISSKEDFQRQRNFLPLSNDRSVRMVQAHFKIHSQTLCPGSTDEMHPPSPGPENMHSV